MPRAGRARQAPALETRVAAGEMGRIRRIAARPAGDEQRSPGRTGIAEVSVRKVAPLPVQSVTAARVFSPDPGPPASLWDWLARLPDPRDRRGVRFTLACVIAVAIAARLAGCDSFTAVGEWAASRPQRVLKALGCPLSKRAGSMSPRRRRRSGGSPGPVDHDLADDLLCGWTAGLAAACEILSPAQLQEQRRDAARKAREKAREAEKKPARPPGGTGRPAARRRRRPARPASRTESRRGRSRGQRAGCRRRPRETPGRLGLRARPGPRGAPGAARRGLRRPPPRPRAARPGCRRQSMPRRQGQRPGGAPAPGVLLAPHPAERCPARRRPENKRDDSHRPRHRRDGPGRGVPDCGRAALPGRSEQAGAGPRRPRHLRDQRQPAPHLPGPERHRLGADPRRGGDLRGGPRPRRDPHHPGRTRPRRPEVPGHGAGRPLERYTTFRTRRARPSPAARPS